MESRAKLLGHPIHPMLIPFPLGLLGMAVIFDLPQSLPANVPRPSATRDDPGEVIT
jgi:uncharacterized membrane protein